MLLIGLGVLIILLWCMRPRKVAPATTPVEPLKLTVPPPLLSDPIVTTMSAIIEELYNTRSDFKKLKEMSELLHELLNWDLLTTDLRCPKSFSGAFRKTTITRLGYRPGTCVRTDKLDTGQASCLLSGAKRQQHPHTLSKLSFSRSGKTQARNSTFLCGSQA